MSQRGVQRKTGAHRVAEVGASTAGIDELLGRVPDGGGERRATVTGRIECDGRDVLSEDPPERVPRARGLGEAVDENEPRGHR